MRTWSAAVLLAATLSAACHRNPAEGQQPSNGPLPQPPASALSAQPDDGQWLMAAKDYANTRYSGLQEITADRLGVDEGDVTPDASFREDLEADSLDLVELIMELEEQFGMEIPDEEAEKITTVEEAVDYVMENQAA